MKKTNSLSLSKEGGRNERSRYTGFPVSLDLQGPRELAHVQLRRTALRAVTGFHGVHGGETVRRRRIQGGGVDGTYTGTVVCRV